jgi:tetrahydromethanopterin S-methyltransferase subunit G
MGDVTAAEFNGLGQRLNGLAVEHATCKGATAQRLDGVERRQDEHRIEIKELNTSVDKVRAELSDLQGRMVGIGVMLSILIPVATAFLTKVLFK